MEYPKGYITPFKIFGNLYFVGSEEASTHIVDTGEGLIMFDSGYQHGLDYVIHNMRLLGLEPKDIKYIVHTHGHIDHFGATAALIELTNAKTFIGKQDKDYATGKRDLSFAKELGMEYKEFFKPDVLLSDGDKIILGNTEIIARHTPGHTEGTTSYFFNVSDGEKVFRAGLLGGTGLNSLSKEFLKKYNLPLNLQNDFICAMERLKEEKVDIFLGNHTFQNKTSEKKQRLEKGEWNAFINPSEWGEYLEISKNAMIELMKKESESNDKNKI